MAAVVVQPEAVQGLDIPQAALEVRSINSWSLINIRSSHCCSDDPGEFFYAAL
jgi:hypothetical protein